LTAESRPIRLLVVDDHPLFRQGVRWALSHEADFEVVGEAAQGEEAMRLAHELEPDVVLCDIHLPDTDGLEVARFLKLRHPQIQVVMMTAYGDEEQEFEAAQAGAAGYFIKDALPQTLLDTLRRAARGESSLDESVLQRPLVASRVLAQWRELQMEGHEIEPLFVPLSPREVEILEHIARGNSNKQIARALRISDQTVKNHITSILRKLAVNDRTQAVVLALRHGWIRVDEVPG
jgi:DNA-binding NarL/FixJ family response regulator